VQEQKLPIQSSEYDLEFRSMIRSFGIELYTLTAMQRDCHISLRFRKTRVAIRGRAPARLHHAGDALKLRARNAPHACAWVSAGAAAARRPSPSSSHAARGVRCIFFLCGAKPVRRSALVNPGSTIYHVTRSYLAG
jgi:hypothetical protein